MKIKNPDECTSDAITAIINIIAFLFLLKKSKEMKNNPVAKPCPIALKLMGIKYNEK